MPSDSPVTNSLTETLSPPTNVLSAVDAIQLQAKWRMIRMSYPGWVVAPKPSRDLLWQFTERWVQPLVQALASMQPPDDLFMLFELQWRLKTVLMPLRPLGILPDLVHVLDKYNPFPTLVADASQPVRPDVAEYRNLDWHQLGHLWIELSFAAARDAREFADDLLFRRMIHSISGIVPQNLPWLSHWHFERCAFHLSRLDFGQVRQMLLSWPESPDDHAWELRRAAILAEIGDLKEAERVAASVLEGVRSRQQPYAPHCYLMSLEGWAMVGLRSINLNKVSSKQGLIGQYRDRWHQLETYRCNPWPDIEIAQASLRAVTASGDTRLYLLNNPRRA